MPRSGCMITLSSLDILLYFFRSTNTPSTSPLHISSQFSHCLRTYRPILGLSGCAAYCANEYALLLLTIASSMIIPPLLLHQKSRDIFFDSSALFMHQSMPSVSYSCTLSGGFEYPFATAKSRQRWSSSRSVDFQKNSSGLRITSQTNVLKRL